MRDGFLLGTGDMWRLFPGSYLLGIWSASPWLLGHRHTGTWAYAECQCQAPFWFTPPTQWWERAPLMHSETVKQS